MRSTLVLLLCLVGFSAFSKTRIVKSSAKLFKKDSDQKVLLYTFSEDRHFKGKDVIAYSRYKDPEGKDVVREEFTYKNGAFKRYKIEKLQTGELGIVEYKDKKVHFYYKDKKGREHRDDEDLEENTMIQDELNPYILKNWDKLMAGETLKVRWIVPQRTETIGFQLSKDDQTTCQGRPATKIKMRPSSFFINLLVSNVYLSYLNDKSHTLCEVVGRTTPYRNVRGEWKDLDAHTVFTLSPAKKK